MLLLILAIFAGIFFYFSPIYKDFPMPTGDYKVGTTFYYLKDENRAEIHSDNKNEKRELMIQVWYPSSNTHKEKFTYLSNITPALKKYYLPEFVTNSILNRPTYANLGSPVFARNKLYPVIIFSHGFNALSGFYTTFMENLASHGYIVVAIEHTYAEIITVFPDGRIIKFNQPNTLSDDQKSQQELDIWIQDIKFVLDKLVELNNSDPILRNSLDLQKIAAFGHSFGGIAALAASRIDNRIKAAINIDGSLSFDKDIESVFDKPVLFILQDYRRDKFLKKRLIGVDITAKEYLDKKLSTFTDFCKKTKNNAYIISLEEASHDSFSDAVLLKLPIPKLLNLDLGEVNAYQAIKLTNNYIVAFFDQYLKNKKSKLLEKLEHCKINYIN